MAVSNNNKKQKNLSGERIIDTDMKQEIRTGFLSYAMSIITDRAVPDVRDGLKPVQRRVLYAMKELGVYHDTPFKKSARIVGEAMGKYHPHGDAAIYGTMARMAQSFSMGTTLVEGQGNFGSIDGDAPAAMRYTEARLSPAGESMMAEIDEGTVEWADNFDGSLKEPTVLPAQIPNLLANGAYGIAVAMTTSMPPYNIGEVLDAAAFRLEHPNSGVEDIVRLMPGPDFPTGGIITTSESDMMEIYRQGKGRLTIRAKYKVERGNGGKDIIVITEIPFSVNKSSLIENIARFARTGLNGEITDIRDESDSAGIRMVIELAKDTVPSELMKLLYSKTNLESGFSVANLALYKGRAKEYSLLELIDIYIEHRREIILRKSAWKLDKCMKKLHITDGFLIAIDKLDAVIKIIRGSHTPAEASELLQSKIKMSKEQAAAVLDMRLQRLTGLEKDKLVKERAELEKNIKTLEKILQKKSILEKTLKQEFAETKAVFGKPRQTLIERSDTPDKQQ